MDRIDCRSQNFDLRQTIFKQTYTHFSFTDKNIYGKLKLKLKHNSDGWYNTKGCNRMAQRDTWTRNLKHRTLK